MIRLDPILVVEGKYDKLQLASLVEGMIITTDGFGIFKDKEKIALLRRLSKDRGAVILTDSDGAGFLIRNRLKQLLHDRRLYHAYIPDREGKERRKSRPSAEGRLGVEGMPPSVLEKALRQAGVTTATAPQKAAITKADFMLWGLSGGPDSAAKRQALQKQLDLPSRMTANTLLEVLCRLYTKEQIQNLLCS